MFIRLLYFHIFPTVVCFFQGIGLASSWTPPVARAVVSLGEQCMRHCHLAVALRGCIVMAAFQHQRGQLAPEPQQEEARFGSTDSLGNFGALWHESQTEAEASFGSSLGPSQLEQPRNTPAGQESSETDAAMRTCQITKCTARSVPFPGCRHGSSRRGVSGARARRRRRRRPRPKPRRKPGIRIHVHKPRQKRNHKTCKSCPRVLLGCTAQSDSQAGARHGGGRFAYISPPPVLPKPPAPNEPNKEKQELTEEEQQLLKHLQAIQSYDLDMADGMKEHMESLEQRQKASASTKMLNHGHINKYWKLKEKSKPLRGKSRPWTWNGTSSCKISQPKYRRTRHCHCANHAVAASWSCTQSKIGRTSADPKRNEIRIRDTPRSARGGDASGGDAGLAGADGKISGSDVGGNASGSIGHHFRRRHGRAREWPRGAGEGSAQCSSSQPVPTCPIAHQSSQTISEAPEKMDPACGWGCGWKMEGG